MSPRTKQPASEIRPDPGQYVGLLNAAKCIAYLRGVGAEIDNATAESWLDSEATSRFLRSERRVTVEGQRWSCRCGAMRGFYERKLGRRQKTTKTPPRCESCGTTWTCMSVVYVVRRDGSVVDHRPTDERWQPITDFIAECTGRNVNEGGER